MAARAAERERARRERNEEPVNERAHALVNSGTGDLDELDALFAETPAGNEDKLFLSLAVPAQVDPSVMTPQYENTDGVAKVKQMTLILALFYHVVNGEPIEEIYDTDSHLFAERTTPVFHT